MSRVNSVLALLGGAAMGAIIAVVRPLVAKFPSVAALAVLISLGAAVYGILSLFAMREQLRGFRCRGESKSGQL